MRNGVLGYYRGKTFPDLEARSEALRGLSYPQRKRSRLDRHLLYVGNPDHQPAPGARQQSLFLIDALMVGEKSSRRSLLSYINHDTQEDNSVRRVRHVEDSEKNRVLFPEGYSVGIYAKRAIFAGEEILINYGDSCHQTLLKTYREYRDFVNDRELEQDGTRARRLTASQRRQPARRATGGQAREAQAGGETFRTEARTKARAEDPMDDQAQEAALLDFILSQNAQSQGQAQAQQQQPTAAAGPDQRAVSKAPELPALPLPSEPVPQQEQGDALMDYILSQIQ